MDLGTRIRLLWLPAWLGFVIGTVGTSAALARLLERREARSPRRAHAIQNKAA